MEPAPIFYPSQRSVLCADDNVLLGEIMMRVFERAGCRAQHVSDGLIAWEWLSRDFTAFDVLVTDHHMPGLTGIELVELLREARFPGHIVVHSSALTEDLRAAYTRFGVTSFVAKSCKPEVLLQALRRQRQPDGGDCHSAPDHFAAAGDSLQVARIAGGSPAASAEKTR